MHACFFLLLKINHFPPLSTPTVVKMVMKEDGFSGFFRGLSSTMMRDIPGYFIFFGGYYFFRKQLAPSNIMNYDDDVCTYKLCVCC